MLKLLGFFLVMGACSLTVEGTGCLGKCPLNTAVDNPVAFLPHENCNMYCVCNFGKPIEMPCPADLHFSPKLMVCVDPAIAECTGNKPEFFIKTTQNSPVEDTNDYKCIGTCPSIDDSDVAVKLAHEDCSKYCLCQEGDPVVKDCDVGLLFSQNDAMCVPSEEADCTGYNPYVTTTPPPVDDATDKGCTIKCPSGYKAVVPHKDCTKFCFCNDGEVTVRDCRKGTHFSPTNAECVAPEVAQCDGINGWVPSDCIGTCPSKPNDKYVILLPHDDCTKYCRCARGKMTIQNCGKGLHFNQKLAMCVKPEEAQCTGVGGVNGEKKVVHGPFINLFY